jgi:hypothetical protein
MERIEICYTSGRSEHDDGMFSGVVDCLVAESEVGIHVTLQHFINILCYIWLMEVSCDHCFNVLR